MNKLFEVTHLDGRPWTMEELRDYAWNNTSLYYLHIEGFLIDEYEDIYLSDSCGNYVPVSDDFKLVISHGDRAEINDE